MDSINRDQPEDNHRDLQGHDAIERIKGVVDKTSTCFFCTAIATAESTATRPMSVQKVDGQGNLWFMSASDSHKNHELEKDPKVSLFFQGSEHSDFLHLRGTASISRERQMIDELWESVMKTWFTGGKDDPRITVIKVVPTEGYYWDNKHGNVVAGIKMMIGAATGRTLDDSIEGRVRP
ncbi:MAG: pyridoxamine 5'-phosphate oxidase family protein [Pseudomonadota bacterium]|nr:pyridoxamine 5'-phosphate oxidase family protein [Pseudomonadota bacterium]